MVSVQEIIYVLYDIYFKIEDFINSYINTPQMVKYDYSSNKDDINTETNYIIYDTEKNIALFKEYTGDYGLNKQFAFFGYYCDNDNFEDITSLMNMFSLNDAVLDFTEGMVPIWINIFNRFHKKVNGKITHFEFIDNSGNINTDLYDFKLEINNLNILHKE